MNKGGKIMEFQNKKTALILEGGALRSFFTCGVLDYFMEKDIYFPCVCGVSAQIADLGDLVGGHLFFARFGRLVVLLLPLLPAGLAFCSKLLLLTLI